MAIMNTYLEVKAKFYVTQPSANVIKVDENDVDIAISHMPVLELENGKKLELIIDSPEDHSESTQCCNVIASGDSDVIVSIECTISFDESLTIFTNNHGVFSRDFSDPNSQNKRLPVTLYASVTDGELTPIAKYVSSDKHTRDDITTDEGIKEVSRTLGKLFDATGIDSEISCDIVNNGVFE